MSELQNDIVQKKASGTEETGSFRNACNSVVLTDNRSNIVAQRKLIETMKIGKAPIQNKANNTGLPDNLKSGIENLSGLSMDDVKVHYNSSQPAQLNAHAYAQGTDIHLAPGQEKHLPHEAWHVVQQKQGRVRPTMQMKGSLNINGDFLLEKEADMMGMKALQKKNDGNDTSNRVTITNQMNFSPLAIQRYVNGKLVRSIARKQYPQTIDHIGQAMKKKKSQKMRIARKKAKANRRDSLHNYPTRKGKDRDEWPMAMFDKGGTGAHVKYIDPSDNRGAGSAIGGALKPFKDGTEVRFNLVGAGNGRVLQLKQNIVPPFNNLNKLPETNRNSIVQRAGWTIGGIARGIVGGVGAVGGALAGTVRGGYKAYMEGKNIAQNLVEGFTEGAQEGYDRPLVAAGTIVGGIAGHVAAGYRGVAGAAEGIVSGYNAGGVKGAIGGAIAGGTKGYVGSVLTGITAGAEIGDRLHNRLARKTIIKHTVSYVTLPGEGTHHLVGKRMVAKLYPDDPVQGSATGPNWTWMQKLRLMYRRANIVRGHLLNHDLGGFGMPENLYPISTKANAEHSDRVEQNVKTLLNNQMKLGPTALPVDYIVNVNENVAHNPNVARFECAYGVERGPRKRVTIRSNLGGDSGGFSGGAKVNDLDGTKWHHEKRRGHDKVEGTSLKHHIDEGRIRFRNGGISKGLKLEGNQEAKYHKGAGDSLQLIYSGLAHECFNHIPGWIQAEMISKFHSSRLETGVLNAVKSSASYEDNIGDEDTLKELMLLVVQEQLEKIKDERVHDVDVVKAEGLVNTSLDKVTKLIKAKVS